ncbi:uncharacterized protein LOC135112447 [Scylla paramamosain]|uniref:uncharacterized protein LOC135112447 n=1 Tax=Scylla paramamosain TaxID=85552 RepID=UPI0030839AFB
MKVRPEENEARLNRNKERGRRDRPERVDRMDRPRAKEKDRRTDAQATQVRSIHPPVHRNAGISTLTTGQRNKESPRESSPKRGRTGAFRVTSGSERNYPASDTSGYYDLTPDSSSGASGAKTFNLEDIPYPTRESERHSPSNMSLSSSSSAPPTPPPPPPTPDTLDAIPIPPPTLDLTNIPKPPVTFTITPPSPIPRPKKDPPAKTQAPGPPSSHGSCPTAPLIRPLALPHACPQGGVPTSLPAPGGAPHRRGAGCPPGDMTATTTSPPSCIPRPPSPAPPTTSHTTNIVSFVYVKR